MQCTPVALLSGPISIRPTMARSRISAPAFNARGMKVTSWLCLAFVEQPNRQKPRYTHGCASPFGADNVASGVSVHW